MESWTADYWEENELACRDELKKDGCWEQIPLLNTTHNHMLKEGQLVRFRGMIQDMCNPVYYLATYEVQNIITDEKTVRSGKYKDSLECAAHEKVLFQSNATVNRERRPMYCISVPAINQWAQYKKNEVMQNESFGCQESSGSGLKRCVEDTGESSGISFSGEQSKRLCTMNSVMETDNSEQRIDLNLPIPSSQAEACLINFYDIDEGQLKINDVIEAAAFLSYDPALVTSSDSGMSEQLPPPSIVPRLHAVAVRPISCCNPLIEAGHHPRFTLDDVMLKAKSLRSELKLVLTQLLLGDTLAADYLICHLISRIYLRQDLLVLGKFSLNLSNMPCSLPDYPYQLYHFLQNLLVKSHYLTMTLDNMNTLTMIPKKNYVTNRLESGMLQLSNKTHLVLDETRLEAGQLNDKGVRNCRALASVITNQRLEYDFQFYPVEFHTDIPVLILSEGKSMLPSDCHLPLEMDPACLTTVNEVFDAASHYLNMPLLSQLRVYLSLVSTADYDLTAEMQQIVQEDFVQMRKEYSKTSAQDLHSLLVLAKFLSLSQGSRCLSKECWETAKQIERQRKERIPNSNQR